MTEVVRDYAAGENPKVYSVYLEGEKKMENKIEKNEKKMYDTVCSVCYKACKVPFEPYPSKKSTIKCLDCYNKSKPKKYIVDTITELPEEYKVMSELPPVLCEFIKNSNWTFAKTMASMPHWYIVKNEVNFRLFNLLVLWIREKGVCRRWTNRIAMYLDYDGHSYWTMGNPLNETTIINRKIIDPHDKNMELPKGTICHSDRNPPPKLFDEIKLEFEDKTQKKL